MAVPELLFGEALKDELAEIAASALCWSRAPRSPSADGLRGARDTGIMRKAL